MGLFSGVKKILGGASKVVSGIGFGNILDFGANIGGTLLTNSANKDMARDATAASKEMMQNRHTWEVADLKRAGLNPLLSANSGGPIGTAAQARSADFGDMGMSSARASKRQQEELKMLEIQKAGQIKQNELTDTQKEESRLRQLSIVQGIERGKHETDRAKYEADSALSKALQDNVEAYKQQKIYKDVYLNPLLQDVMPYIDRFGGSALEVLKAGANVLKYIKGGAKIDVLDKSTGKTINKR